MPRKLRIVIPEDTAAALLFQSDRTCCKCRERGKSVQIHHIDEDPSNNVPENLAVLCIECHEETLISGGFGRKLDAAQVVRYRDDWYERVKKRRDEADNIASLRQSSLNAEGDVQNEQRSQIPNSEKLKNYIQTLPAIRRITYERSRPLWDSGRTGDMKHGCFIAIDVFEQTLATLTSWYPKSQFGGLEPRGYINDVITSRYTWHRSHIEPLGGGTGGTMVGLSVAGLVLEDIERMVVEVVSSLAPHIEEFDLLCWKQQWDSAAKSSDEG